MSPTPTTVHVRLRAAVLGFGLGASLAVVLTLGGVFSVPQPVRAQTTQEDLCMAKAECIDLKVAKGGDCDAEHCFETGHGCQSGGQGYCYAKWAPTQLTVGFGGITKVADIGDLMVKFYDWSMGIAAALAAIMMMVGGFMYLSSFGESGAITKGKKRIMDAAVGLIIVATAYTILQTVNPDLVRFRLPKFPTVKRSFMVMCKPWEVCAPCGQKFYVKIPKGGAPTANKDGTGDCSMITSSKTQSDTDAAKYDLSSECLGKGCTKLGGDFCSDVYNRCTEAMKGETPKIAGGCTPNPDCVKAFNTCLGSKPGGSDCADQLSKCNANAAAATSDGADQKVDVGIGTSGVTNSWYCKSCKMEGTPCNKAGKDSSCCGGLCVSARGSSLSTTASGLGAGNGDQTTTEGASQALASGGFICSSGAVGAPCGRNEDCATNYCYKSYIAGGYCTTGGLGSPCNDGSECNGLACSKPADSKIASVMVGGVCTDKEDYSYCGGNADCKSGKCHAGLCYPVGASITMCDSSGSTGRNSRCPEATPMCSAGTTSDTKQGATSQTARASAMKFATAVGGTGPLADLIMKGYDLTGGVMSATACAAIQGTINSYCFAKKACGGGVCDPCDPGYDNATYAWDLCSPEALAGLVDGNNVCTPGAPGNPCTKSQDCSGGAGSKGCGNGICSNGAAGTRCDNTLGDTACVEGYKCVKFTSWSNQSFCVTGKEGSPCTKAGRDADCIAGYKCDIAEGGTAERGSCVVNTATKKK